MATWGAWDRLDWLDRQAAEVARSAGGLRLLLGEALARIDSRSAHHALGFASLGTYAAERCNRGVTWARDAMRYAREVEPWPDVRCAVLAGRVTWSALGLLLRALRPYAEARAALSSEAVRSAEQIWVERAQSMTVRAFREAVRDASGEACEATCSAGAESDDVGGEVRSVHPFLRRLPAHVLTLTVGAELAWWFHCARSVYERSVCDCPAAARSAESFVLSLLAEARTELEGDAPLDEEAVERWGAYVEMLEEWREESERRCDEQRSQLVGVGGYACVSSAGAMRSDVERSDVERSDDPAELDSEVRRLAARLARRDLELGRLADWLQRAEAWRRLGFASEAHYVIERMGCSYSQWKTKRALARQLSRRPEVQAAVTAGEIGVEAAALLLRVVTDERSEQQWVARAKQRTFKHLREEVRVAELGAQQLGHPALPPSEDTMRRALALEGRVKSGSVLLEEAEVPPASESRMSVEGRMSVASRAWLDLRGELWKVFRGAFLPDPGEPAGRREPGVYRKGQVRLRLRLERDTLVEYRALEKLFRTTRADDFFEFLCRHFLAVWAPAMLTDVKYAHIYRRDAFTCSSPVCSRHDVQPHHLTFRSHGGGEEDENLTTLCTWCHLEGVHGGRLRVRPPASAMRWRIGAAAPFEVRGRQKIAG